MKTLHEYGALTVGDLVRIVNENKDKFPKGMRTRIVCGDYEGNYSHEQVSVEDWSGRPSDVLVISYELHD